jgi:hypothetical protein
VRADPGFSRRSAFSLGEGFADASENTAAFGRGIDPH